MHNQTDFLRQEYTIDTPENVTFGYDIAGIGSRFIGALVDTVILVVALVVLNLVIGVILAWSVGPEKLFTQNDENIGWVGGLILAVSALVNFMIFWGYYIVFELLWNGQTPGKRVAKVRVVRLDGNPAGFMEIVVRNLVRIVDFLPSAYGIGLLTMFFNQRARRLGDFAAGTLVVKARADIGVETLGRPTPSVQASSAGVINPTDEAILQQFPALRRLSAADIALVHDALNRYAAGKVDRELLGRLATAIATKLDAPAPAQEPVKFLNAVVEAYRHSG
ncbi:MAG: RDD family protein [Caldilineaceae bacterium]